MAERARGPMREVGRRGSRLASTKENECLNCLKVEKVACCMNWRYAAVAGPSQQIRFPVVELGQHPNRWGTAREARRH